MKQHQESTGEEKISLWNRVEFFAERQPKKAFYIMFGMIFLSVLISIGNLIYVQKVSVPEYEKLKKENVLKNATTSLGVPIRETENIMDMRDALKELEYYRGKASLSPSDSVRIKYLLDKYQINKR